MIEKYIAPKLTKYGKIENIIQAGSVELQSGEVTGDDIPDTAFDTNGDGKADVIVGGASGGVTPVTFVGNATNGFDSFDFYDSDGDGTADIAIGNFINPFSIPTLPPPGLRVINSITEEDNYLNSYIVFSYGDIRTSTVVDEAGINVETSSEGGWDDPARD